MTVKPINSGSYVEIAGAVDYDLLAPGKTETARLTIAQRAEAYKPGEFLMRSGAEFAQWDGGAAPHAFVTHEIDASAGPVLADVLVEARVMAGSVILPAAIADQAALQAALVGSEFHAVILY